MHLSSSSSYCTPTALTRTSTSREVRPPCTILHPHALQFTPDPCNTVDSVETRSYTWITLHGPVARLVSHDASHTSQLTRHSLRWRASRHATHGPAVTTMLNSVVRRLPALRGGRGGARATPMTFQSSWTFGSGLGISSATCHVNVR